MCGTAAGGFMCFIVRRIARPFTSWSDTPGFRLMARASASSLEASHEQIADAFACGGDRGAGRVLLNPVLPPRCLACPCAHHGAPTMMPRGLFSVCGGAM